MTTTEYILSKPSLTNLTFKDLKAYYEDSIKPICEANNNPFPLWIYNQDDKANVTVKDLEILVKSIFGDAMVELPVKLFSQSDSLIVNIGLLSVVHNEYVIPSGVVPSPDVQITVNEAFTAIGLANDGSDITIDWGDGTTETLSGSLSTLAYSHSYSLGNYQIKIYNTAISTIYCDNYDGESGIGTANSVISVDICDVSISDLIFNFQNTITDLDAALKTTLKTCNLGYNQFNTTTVNNILVALDSAGVTSCVVYLSQSPPAPPSGAGATAKANLISAGNTVNTN
jgi:hypothetical protein